MRICGCDLTGSDIILVLIEGSASGWEFIPSRVKRLSLADTKNADEVKSLCTIVSSFFRENAVELVVIRQRSEKGGYAGGATTFKLEGIIQLASSQSVIFVSPQRAASRMKKSPIPIPERLNKYQESAYLVAAVAMQDHG